VTDFVTTIPPDPLAGRQVRRSCFARALGVDRCPKCNRLLKGKNLRVSKWRDGFTRRHCRFCEAKRVADRRAKVRCDNQGEGR
jgi:hypothetical protein